MCANVTLKLCTNEKHLCAQMKTVHKQNFLKMCANVIAPYIYYSYSKVFLFFCIVLSHYFNNRLNNFSVMSGWNHHSFVLT